MIDTLHDQIRYLEKINLEKDKLILDLKKQVEIKNKIIKNLEREKKELINFPLAHIDTI